MRISDWSSDVCSSDLLMCSSARHRPRSAWRAARSANCVQEPKICFISLACGSGRQALLSAVGAPLRDPGHYACQESRASVSAHRPPSLGRESCREHVVQYVELPVDAVHLKKEY